MRVMFKSIIKYKLSHSNFDFKFENRNSIDLLGTQYESKMCLINTGLVKIASPSKSKFIEKYALMRFSKIHLGLDDHGITFSYKPYTLHFITFLS